MITYTASTLKLPRAGLRLRSKRPLAFREMRGRKLFRLLVSARACGHMSGLAPDIRDGDCPERNEVHAGNEFYQERGEKLPVPAEQVSQGCCHAEIENVFGRRKGAFNK